MREDEDVYTPGPPESVSPDDPIIFGRRWKAERDEARVEAARWHGAFDGLAAYEQELRAERDEARAQSEALAEALEALTAASEEFFRPNSLGAPVWPRTVDARETLRAYRSSQESSDAT